MKIALSHCLSMFALATTLTAPARADVYGLKSAPDFVSFNSPTALYTFTENGASFVEIGRVTVDGSSPLEADALAISETWGLLAWRMDRAFNAAHDAIVVIGSTIMHIDPVTALGTPFGSPLVGREIRGAVFDQFGALWVIDAKNDEVLQINPLDGSILGTPTHLTWNGAPYDVTPETDIAVRCDGTMLMSGFQDALITTFVFKLSPSSGSLTLVGSVALVNPGLTFSKNAPDIDDLFGFEAQATDDIFRYDAAACFAPTELFHDIISPDAEGFNSGQGDLAALIAAPGSCAMTKLCDDCNDNGLPDCLDVDSFLTPDCNGNATPDCIDISIGKARDCNGNGIPDSCDIANSFSHDCNGNGVPDSCEIESGASPDCNGNGIPDTCDIVSGFSHDCNSNGVPDSCDIANSTVPDCDGNGVPDVCDMASGAGQDCNGNGTPDSCDIANGNSHDTNGNGVPDECEDPSVLAQNLCAEISALPLSLFIAPNDNARHGQRDALATRACRAAERLANGQFASGRALLKDVLDKIDDITPPPDWIVPSLQKASLATKVRLVLLLVP